MDIIQAWKMAKVGEYLNRGKGGIKKYGKGGIKKYGNDIYDFLRGFDKEMLLADDWEVESKPLVWEGEVVWEQQYLGYSTSIDYFPPNIIYPILNKNKEMGLSEFLGKRTRIRIEEII